MKYSSRRVPVIVAFAGLAVVAAGCSDSRMAANNAASNSSDAESTGYRTAYGVRSEPYTTDIATELKGSFHRADRPQAQAAGTVQQGTPAGVNGQQAAASGSVQPAASPPPQDSSPTAYGISADGPTTDVYTAFFGPRNH